MKNKLKILILILFLTMFFVPFNVMALTIGDEVSLGAEKFIVIGQDSSSIKLLAKYNLFVGSICTDNGSSYDCIDIDTDVENYGLQNSNTYETSYYDYTVKQAYTKFSNIDTTYENSIVKAYVDNYVNYLNNTNSINVSGSLITSEELLSLGCDEDSYSCNVYDWLLDTSYWTLTPKSGVDGAIKTIGSNNIWGYCGYNYPGFGVRPVITLSLSDYDNIMYSYEYISGDNQEFVAGNVDSYIYEIDANYLNFDSIVIDNLELTKDIDFNVTEGSTIITFTSLGLEKLNTLSVGTYDVITKYINNKNVIGKLIIKPNTNVPPLDNNVEQLNPLQHQNNIVKKENHEQVFSKADNPKTYDDVIRWIVLEIISFIGIVASIYFKKRV